MDMIELIKKRGSYQKLREFIELAEITDQKRIKVLEDYTLFLEISALITKEKLAEMAFPMPGAPYPPPLMSTPPYTNPCHFDKTIRSQQLGDKIND